MVRRFAAGVCLFLGCLLFGLTVLQGVTLCLCAPDPDGCGEHCHDCGSMPEPLSEHVDHVCDHLKVLTLQPAKITAAGMDDLLVVLFEALVAPPACLKPIAPVAPVLSRTARPPDVLHPQLGFLAYSTQILC